jgi:hypothetical protein
MEEPVDIQQILNAGSDYKYFNGFSVAVAIGDVLISLNQNGKQPLILNTSYTVAKTLAQALTESISQLEEKTGNHIMTVNEIQEKLLNSPK